MKYYMIIIIAIGIIGFGCTGQGNTNQEKLTIGLQSTPSSALVIVASENGYFKQQDLDVELTEFTAGKLALQAFIAKKVDFAVVGDVPVVLAAIQGNRFYVLGQTVEETSENRVLVLRDPALQNPNPTEYFTSKKRKLSTSIGGTPEFYTYNFLRYYNIHSNSVEIIAQKPEDMPSAIISGSVDGISIFEPYPTIAQEQLSNKTESFSLPKSEYSPLYVLVANSQWVDKNPQDAKKFMRALIQAQQFIEDNPTEAQKIVAKRTRFSEEVVKSIWSEYSIGLAITPQLFDHWNAEARWAIETNKTNTTIIPDFHAIVKPEFLEAAKSSG